MNPAVSAMLRGSFERRDYIACCPSLCHRLPRPNILAIPIGRTCKKSSGCNRKYSFKNKIIITVLTLGRTAGSPVWLWHPFDCTLPALCLFWSFTFFKFGLNLVHFQLVAMGMVIFFSDIVIKLFCNYRILLRHFGLHTLAWRSKLHGLFRFLLLLLHYVSCVGLASDLRRYALWRWCYWLIKLLIHERCAGVKVLVFHVPWVVIFPMIRSFSHEKLVVGLVLKPHVLQGHLCWYSMLRIAL